MENKKKAEEARRAKLLKMRAERLPDIKKQFEEAQKRNFNANFAPGGKDEKLVKKTSTRKKADDAAKKTAKATKTAKGGKTAAKQEKKQLTPAQAHNVALGVSTRKGEMVHHQRMLSQDVNAQATQHIIGIPVNKSRYNGYNGEQITNAKLKQMRPDPEAVRIIPIGGVGEFGIGKNMTIIEYKSEMIVVDMGVLFAGDDYPGVNYLIPDIKYLEDNVSKVKAICFTHAHLDHIGACRHLLPKF